MTIALPRALLERLRAGGMGAEDARARLAVDARHGDTLRAAVTSALAGDLRLSDRPIARWLLEVETVARTERGGDPEALYTLVAALARFGQAADALALWRARAATAETLAGVDPEQFARAGLSDIRAYLAGLTDGEADAVEARAALAWLDAQEDAGAFDDLPAYFAWSDERYGVRISGPT